MPMFYVNVMLGTVYYECKAAGDRFVTCLFALASAAGSGARCKVVWTPAAVDK